MLNGSANMEYMQEGDKGLIAAPEDVRKASSLMFMFIGVHVCRML